MSYDLWVDEVLGGTFATLGDAIAAADIEAPGSYITVEWITGETRNILLCRDGADRPMLLTEEPA